MTEYKRKNQPKKKRRSYKVKILTVVHLLFTGLLYLSIHHWFPFTVNYSSKQMQTIQVEKSVRQTQLSELSATIADYLTLKSYPQSQIKVLSFSFFPYTSGVRANSVMDYQIKGVSRTYEIQSIWNKEVRNWMISSSLYATPQILSSNGQEQFTNQFRLGKP
jgi:hypothetical protein